ncbi:hypothetical protein CEXT_87701 [Caerostris extrusa]|uniref:Uncharacterized protein n=1 Tax=Caerostris extrusa TaxID=172846 RepID=A0AAV4Y3U0_CAEEX|nr:hypothetical protein CEXT_87701 [Caerostris extrusa]
MVTKVGYKKFALHVSEVCGKDVVDGSVMPIKLRSQVLYMTFGDGLQNEFRENGTGKEGPKKRGLEQLSIKIPGTRVLIALTVSRVAYYGPLPAPPDNHLLA